MAPLFLSWTSAAAVIALAMALVTAHRVLVDGALSAQSAALLAGAATLATLLWLGCDCRSALTGGAICGACIVVAEIDRRKGIIPDDITVALALVAVGAALDSNRWIFHLSGAAMLGALFLGVRWFTRDANGRHTLGLGDVKYACAAGALLGALDGLLMSAVAGVATVATLLIARPMKPAKFNAAAPFGVTLSAALTLMVCARAWSAA